MARASRLDGQECRFDGPIRQFTLTNLNSYGASVWLLLEALRASEVLACSCMARRTR